MSAAAPYPADTRAKGWRFELDYEAIQQSDTWALADEVPMAQPALLMMWLTAWAQIPCGSFPNDETVIRAKCKIPPKEWPKLRDVLMRGWWLADDGRLYHPTITQRVLDMLGKKDAEKNRKAEYRKRKEAESKLADANEQARMSHGTDVYLSHGTDAGQTPDGRGIDATRTRTGTGLDSSNPPPGVGVDNLSHGTDAGRICRLMKQAGLQQVNPSNVTLKVLIDAGASDAEFVEAAQAAVKKGAGFAYALSIVTNERKRAAELGGQIHKGQMGKPDPLQDPDSRESIEAAGVELGLGKWVPFDTASGTSEPWPRYVARVRKAQGCTQSAEAASVADLVMRGLATRRPGQTAMEGA